MARARPLSPDSRRAQLLAAARTVFATKGYQRSSVSDVIKAAGVSRGTFYNYFDGKSAIFQAVLVDLTGKLPPGDVRLRLRSTLKLHWDAFFLGAAPAGWPAYGQPAEAWADCVARVFTGSALPSHGLPPCGGSALSFASTWLLAGPQAHPVTR